MDLLRAPVILPLCSSVLFPSYQSSSSLSSKQHDANHIQSSSGLNNKSNHDNNQQEGRDVNESTKATTPQQEQQLSNIPCRIPLQIIDVDEQFKSRILLSDKWNSIWALLSDECVIALEQERAHGSISKLKGSIVELEKYHMDIYKGSVFRNNINGNLTWDDVEALSSASFATSSKHSNLRDDALPRDRFLVHLVVYRLSFIDGDECPIFGKPVEVTKLPIMKTLIKSQPLGLLSRIVMGSQGVKDNSKWVPSFDLVTATKIAKPLLSKYVPSSTNNSSTSNKMQGQQDDSVILTSSEPSQLHFSSYPIISSQQNNQDDRQPTTSYEDVADNLSLGSNDGIASLSSAPTIPATSPLNAKSVENHIGNVNKTTPESHKRKREKINSDNDVEKNSLDELETPGILKNEFKTKKQKKRITFDLPDETSKSFSEKARMDDSDNNDDDLDQHDQRANNVSQQSSILDGTITESMIDTSKILEDMQDQNETQYSQETEEAQSELDQTIDELEMEMDERVAQEISTRAKDSSQWWSLLCKR